MEFISAPDAAAVVFVAPADSAAAVELLVELELPDVLPDVLLLLLLLLEVVVVVDVDPQDEVVGVLVAKPTSHGTCN